MLNLWEAKARGDSIDCCVQHEENQRKRSFSVFPVKTRAKSVEKCTILLLASSWSNCHHVAGTPDPFPRAFAGNFGYLFLWARKWKTISERRKSRVRKIESIDAPFLHSSTPWRHPVNQPVTMTMMMMMIMMNLCTSSLRMDLFHTDGDGWRTVVSIFFYVHNDNNSLFCLKRKSC